MDLGASSRSSHLLLAARRHLCQGSRERKELCALAWDALEMNGTEGKIHGKDVCTKHLEAFHAFFEVGTGRHWGKKLWVGNVFPTIFKVNKFLLKLWVCCINCAFDRVSGGMLW